MFLCQPCTDARSGAGHYNQHVHRSHGPCELCGVTGACADCRCATTARQSDPPGLVGVVGEFQRARANYRRAKHEDIGQEDAWARLKAARDAVLAYPLPASPQAETKGDK